MTSPTLQDFVLNLIYDPIARSAFELDPEATLRHAGLDDITASDVQQVLPLVLDSAPVAGLTGPDGIDGLTTGVASLDVAGAVAQLQAITAQVPVPDTIAEFNATSSMNATVLGLNAGGVAEMSVLPDSLSVGTAATAGGLSADNDPALDLDRAVTEPAAVSGISTIEPYGDGPVPDIAGVLEPVIDIPQPIVPDTSGLLDATGVDEATSSVGSLIKPDLGGVSPVEAVDGLGDTVSGVVTGVDGALHDVSGLLSGGETTYSTFGVGD